ncbi:MAG: SIMPL domain-containing protein [Synechococcaceae cyanobacterium]|nr:SIMPL domain-containing protein [Synechococcaceae cyanobacterium]
MPSAPLPPQPRRRRSGLALTLLLPGPVLLLGWPAPGHSQMQLRCEGTFLEARGQAEVERPTRRLDVSLSLQAEARDADGALGLLQQRLASVRRTLQELGVAQLRVSSPSTWQRPAEPNRPAQVEASLQVSGQLKPEQLQPLIRRVGSLPGVRLSPVQTNADPSGDAATRRQLLRAAYRDALNQAQDIAAAIGRRQLDPLEVQLDGGEVRPVMLRMAAEAAPAPFDPAELPTPRSRLSLMVRFCAR